MIVNNKCHVFIYIRENFFPERSHSAIGRNGFRTQPSFLPGVRSSPRQTADGAALPLLSAFRDGLLLLLLLNRFSRVDSVRPHGGQPTTLPHPWDSPGKNTGVGCHFLLQCMKVKSEMWKWSRSVMSDSQRPHGLQPTRQSWAEDRKRIQNWVNKWNYAFSIIIHLTLYWSVLSRTYFSLSLI